MDALRHAHEVLAPGGRLLLVHPYGAENPIEAAGGRLGALDAREFGDTVRAAEAGVAALVAEGLFAQEDERRFEVAEHFADAEELLEEVAGWQGTRTPAELAAAVRAAAPPLLVRLPLVLLLFRVIG